MINQDEDTFIITDDSGFSPGLIYTGGTNSQGNVTVGSGTIGGASYNLSNGINGTFGYGIVNSSGVPVSSVFISSSPKKDVKYIVVLQSGACKELVEQTPVTAREIVGICKFINLAHLSMSTSVRMEWEYLMSSLGIARHFVNGKSSHTEYNDDSIAYIKLFSV